MIWHRFSFVPVGLLAALLLSGAPQRAASQSGAPSWVDIGPAAPIGIQPSTPLTGRGMTADPEDPSRIAYCSPGAIQLSNDGGATWSAIPTAGAEQAAANSPFPIWNGGGNGPAACVSPVLDSQNPQSFYATFMAVKAPYGAPPIFFAGYTTGDGGQTWQPAPVPDGYTQDQFGGFQGDGQSVQALFGRAPIGGAPRSNPSLDVAVEQTDDGGQTWTPSALACPAAGPCVRWGPAPNGIGSCAMNEHPQPIEMSVDNGQSWMIPPSTSGANGCDDNELVALSSTDVMLLSGRSDHPLWLSSDGSVTWDAIALPAPPGSGSGPLFLPGLQMLPDGSLLAWNDGSWYRLQPAGSAWCLVTGAALPGQQVRMVVVGDSLWWIAPSDTPGAVSPAQSVSLGSLSC